MRAEECGKHRCEHGTCVYLGKGKEGEKKPPNILGRKSKEIVPLGSMIGEGWDGCTEVRNGAVTRMGEAAMRFMQGLVGYIKKSGLHYKSNEEVLEAFR